MRERLSRILRDPIDREPLQVHATQIDGEGTIRAGELVSPSGRRYPIQSGVPRFVSTEHQESVDSFGEEWNHFNYDAFRANWQEYVVRNTFDSVDAFRDKIVVDAGAGSGMQTRWIAEAGAKQVIALELSHSVDQVLAANLSGLESVDVIQCSIDAPPLADGCADLVYCHNVIQHTPSVEVTARALWRLVANGGELVFNCYQRNDQGLVRRVRFAFNALVRSLLSRQSFRFRLAYSRVMALLRFVPILGWALERANLMYRGVVPRGPRFLERAYRQGMLNTFDWFGSHAYQHYKTEQEMRALLAELQPDATKIANLDRYFMRPPPPGCALRVRK